MLKDRQVPHLPYHLLYQVDPEVLEVPEVQEDLEDPEDLERPEFQDHLILLREEQQNWLLVQQ
jgi:hypothetical protein